MGKTDMPPVVLLIAGNDPSGGAGLAADIQAVTAAGAHPAPVVAALTVQDSRDVQRVQAVAAELVAEQAHAVLADMPVAAIKLGLLADAATGRQWRPCYVSMPLSPWWWTRCWPLPAVQHSQRTRCWRSI